MRAGKRQIKLDSQYNNFFETPDGSTLTQKKNGSVHDTIKAIVHVSNNYHNQTIRIAQKLKGKSVNQTAENIYNFCFNYFQYREDENGKDTVRTPNRAWADRKEGIDCDCYSALISCILTNLGLTHTIRMSANYKVGRYNHVYIVLYDENGQEICIDPVIDTFNCEHPYLSKNDTLMEVQVLNGLNPKPSRDNFLNRYQSKPIIAWIINQELRKDSRIRKAISSYSKRNNINRETTEDIFAKILLASDEKRWYQLAKSKRIIKRSNRSYSISSKDVITYIGLTNSNVGLLALLLHDANIFEIWLETTNNLEFATQIVNKIIGFKQNKTRLRKEMPFQKVAEFAKTKTCVKSVPTTCNKSHLIVSQQDPMCNFLQLTVVVNTGQKGRMIKQVKRMFNPDNTKESKLLHSKLSNVYRIKERADQLNVGKESLNGFFTALTTAAGAAFGVPQVGAIVGGTVENMMGSGGSGYIKGEVYVWPDGQPYNRANKTNVNLELYNKRMEVFRKKPYADAVILKYNQLKAQKGNVDPTQTEYLTHISPIIKSYEAKIRKQNQDRLNEVKNRKLAETRALKVHLDNKKKAKANTNKAVKYVLAIGTTSAAAYLGYNYLKNKK